MTFENTSWNVESIGKEIKDGLTESEFVDRKLSEGAYKEFRKEDRIYLLVTVYEMIKTKTN